MSSSATDKLSSVRSEVARGGQIHVIKVGTSTILTNDETGGQKANLSNLARLVELIASLRKAGDHVILVSSGAVGMGCLKLGLSEKPAGLGAKQAMAAAGQSRLMRLYEDLAAVIGMQVAQLLITREDFSDKKRFLTVRHTIYELIRLGVVPIVNENDSLAADHVAKFGDNDTLAAMTAALVEANWLFLATDVDFLYTANPKDNPDAKPIYAVEDVTKLRIAGLESSTSQWGTGGMATKLIAASIAVAAGVHCGLATGSEPERIGQMIRGIKEGGTHFIAHQSPDVTLQGHHSRWILALPLTGTITIDAKGYRAVLKGYNIFSQSVMQVEGEFEEDEAVALTYGGKQVARALVRASSTAIKDAVKDRRPGKAVLGLRDFTAELAAAGVFLKDYQSWRKGGHKGASGEMNAQKIAQLEQKAVTVLSSDQNGSAPPTIKVIAWANDIVMTALSAMMDAKMTSPVLPGNNIDNPSKMAQMKRARSASPPLPPTVNPSGKARRLEEA
ncbi:unnamed protein product [Polarella glacialis]|uniref:PUA domain-containing protein n=1 Tax=Polarella glacialis TaxID=89957 RepID=A0A813G6M6_POLGL|nr:unnamed protein product [Polarella glacialis]